MERVCGTCGKTFLAQRRTAKFCSDECRYHNWLANKKRVTIPRDMRFSILRRDGFRCRYCGAQPPRKELRVDHVVSIADGGARTDFDNLVTACNDCNAGKGGMSIDPSEVPPAAEA
jgi:5-methylcytosine-specific restriction endonuclease McrA